MRTSRMIRSLPLPAGGHSRYLITLRECLGWLDATEGTTVEAMETWIGQKYGVKDSTASIYVRILAVLDLRRGDTDLLINAKHQDFRAIVDSKARSERLNQFDVYAINKHRDKHNTSFAL